MLQLRNCADAHRGDAARSHYSSGAIVLGPDQLCYNGFPTNAWCPVAFHDIWPYQNADVPSSQNSGGQPLTLLNNACW